MCDAALAYAEIHRRLHGGPFRRTVPATLSNMALGTPAEYFWDDLTLEVAAVTSRAVERLTEAGAHFQAVSIPEASEREGYFPVSMPVQLLNTLGLERFEANRHLMDPVIAERTALGIDMPATQLLEVETRRKQGMSCALKGFQDVDAWISPTTASTAPSVDSLANFQEAYRQAINMTRNTQPANYLGLCAASIPLPLCSSSFPVGLQLMCPPYQEERLLGICQAIETSLAAT